MKARAIRPVLFVLAAPLLLLSVSPGLTQPQAQPGELPPTLPGGICASTRVVLNAASPTGWTPDTAPKVFTWEEGRRACTRSDDGKAVVCDLIGRVVCDGDMPDPVAAADFANTNKSLGTQGPGLIMACIPGRTAEVFNSSNTNVTMQGVDFTASGAPKIRLFQRVEHTTSAAGKACLDERVQIEFDR